MGVILIFLCSNPFMKGLEEGTWHVEDKDAQVVPLLRTFMQALKDEQGKPSSWTSGQPPPAATPDSDTDEGWNGTSY